MKAKSLAGLAALACLSGIADPLAVTSPVPVNGSGSFDTSIVAGDFQFTASGSNGADTVSIWVIHSPDLPTLLPPGVLPLINGSGFAGSASIDGVASDWFSYDLSNGSGFLTILDPTDHVTVLATAPLVEYLYETSYDVGVETTSGTFAITSTPEPAAISLVSAGVLLLWSYRRRRRRVFRPRLK